MVSSMVYRTDVTVDSADELSSPKYKGIPVDFDSLLDAGSCETARRTLSASSARFAEVRPGINYPFAFSYCFLVSTYAILIKVFNASLYHRLGCHTIKHELDYGAAHESIEGALPKFIIFQSSVSWFSSSLGAS